MTVFKDERNPEKVITEIELEEEYRELKKKGEIDYPFYKYIEECTSKNGTLSIIEPTTFLCPRCHKRLYPSDLANYAYVCYDCDENFFKFEAIDPNSAIITTNKK